MTQTTANAMYVASPAHYAIVVEGRYHLVVCDGRQIARCRSREAAEKVVRVREEQIAANLRDREAETAEIDAREREAAALGRSLRSRLRKVVSHEPGHAVNRLGERCQSLPTYWGGGYGVPRTCIVVMRDGASTEGTHRLTWDDYSELVARIESDDECRAICRRAAGVAE